MSTILFPSNACYKAANNDLFLNCKNQDETLLKKLRSYGITDEKIQNIGNNYLVDGDLLMQKINTDLTFLDKFFAKQDIREGDTEQATKGLVNTDNIEQLRILPQISGTSVASWEKPIKYAMAH